MSFLVRQTMISVMGFLFRVRRSRVVRTSICANHTGFQVLKEPPRTIDIFCEEVRSKAHTCFVRRLDRFVFAVEPIDCA